LPPDDSAASGTYGGFVRAFEGIQIVLAPRFRRGPLWPLFEWFKDTTKDHNEAIDAWLEPLITKALEDKKLRDGKKLSQEEGSLTDHLVESTSDVSLIRDELMNILLAARDTVKVEFRLKKSPLNLLSFRLRAYSPSRVTPLPSTPMC